MIFWMGNSTFYYRNKWNCCSWELCDRMCLMPRAQCNGRRGGGASIIFETHNNTKCYAVWNSYNALESVFLIVKHKKLNFILGSIYCVPTNTSSQDFQGNFSGMTFLAYEHRPVILASNLNVKMNVPNSISPSSFSTLTSEMDFCPLLPSAWTYRLGNILAFTIYLLFTLSLCTLHFSGLSYFNQWSLFRLTFSTQIPFLLA